MPILLLRRRPMVLAIIVILNVLKYVTVIFGSDSNPLEVTSPAGNFKGTALLSLQEHIYIGFLGIPFALPPIGALRFAKPKPYPKIEHVYDASKPTPVCIQPAGIDLGSPAQEDCLYLNVYIPEKNTKDKQEGDVLKKVFVYIHGGAFFMGSSREYIPGDLVALGDVIVVTLNYRLSWLGFLKGNTSELPGNQGMWDQLMALQWVNNNIRYFGGDPDDITIGGNSMGGESVSALSIVPHGKGLFTKGLIMSGTMFTCPSTHSSSDILLDLLTDRIGCKLESTEATVRCLRELPAERFVLPIEGSLTNKFTTIDGDFFPSPIMDLIKNKNYLEKVGFYSRDYIVSITNNEGAIEFFGPLDLGIDPDKMSASSLSQVFHVPVPVCEKILTWYQQPGHFSFKPSHDIICDNIMVLPTYRFLETFASYNIEKFNIQWPAFDLNSKYSLSFNSKPSIKPSPVEERLHFWDTLFPEYLKDYSNAINKQEL